MPALTADAIKDIVAKFVPESLQDNPLVAGLLAGAAAVAVLLSTPAFAPVGVVGATGWVIVYVVTGGTAGMKMVSKLWDVWRGMSADRRAAVDEQLRRLKRARDDGALTDDEYCERARTLLDALS